ncbi:hypothetical protein D3C87_1534180 [compost metagenome]
MDLSELIGLAELSQVTIHIVDEFIRCRRIECDIVILAIHAPDALEFDIVKFLVSRLANLGQDI